MDFYHLIRPLLFSLPTEVAHETTLSILNFLYRISLLVPAKQEPGYSVKLMGLTFPNRVGLAAGLDKNADYVDALTCLGFGFIEVGTVTPLPQAGNPKPRLFRLPEDNSLINRLGFNNKGVDYLASNLEKMDYRGIIGVNMGKNANTPLEKAADDYIKIMRAVYTYSSYMVVNISSPNTPGLRELQGNGYLDALLSQLKAEQKKLLERYHRHVPLIVKVAPDLTSEQVKEMAETFVKHEIEGIIATNTTISRPLLKNKIFAKETGGLSGKALKQMADDILMQFNQCLGGRIPLIGVGGISSAEDACEKFARGASLIQIYTGLVYEGPKLIKKTQLLEK